MRAQSILVAALAWVPAVFAHTVFTDFYIDGMPQGDGVAMRMNPDAQAASSPIASLDSDDMACNVGGTKGVSRVQPVKDGALLTFEVRTYPSEPSKMRLSRTHKGPCAVYLKKVDAATTDRAVGDGWFKIFDHGYDNSTDRWCTDEIIDNNGLLSVHIPNGLQGGDYLVRPEILALHAAYAGDPQLYTGCAQIFLENNGNLVPESTVSIPGHIKYGEPSTNFDIYSTPNSKYILPGPKIAQLTAGGVEVGPTTQTDGLKPASCIMENGNWCGKEVPLYSTEAGCWAAGEDCWAQSKVCYSTSPPTGSTNCQLWDAKCRDIQGQCTAKNFNGPPNEGRDLTPVKKSIDVGLVMPTVGGNTLQSALVMSSLTKGVESKTDRPTEATPTLAAAPAKSKIPATNSATGHSSGSAPAESYATHEAAVTVTALSSSVAAPASTMAPACHKGWKRVTVTKVEVFTQTVYA